MTKPIRLGICGVHGTGKTTLLKELRKLYQTPEVTRTMRTMWENFGVEDFEKLPPEVRGEFQKYAILNQIELEYQAGDNFLTDRTVIDNLAYTYDAGYLSQVDLKIYEALVKEHLRHYTHIVYCPIEFEVENERLRADIESRERMDKLYQRILKQYLPNNYLTVRGGVAQRVGQIQKYLSNV